MRAEKRWRSLNCPRNVQECRIHSLRSLHGYWHSWLVVAFLNELHVFCICPKNVSSSQGRFGRPEVTPVRRYFCHSTSCSGLLKVRGFVQKHEKGSSDVGLTNSDPPSSCFLLSHKPPATLLLLHFHITREGRLRREWCRRVGGAKKHRRDGQNNDAEITSTLNQVSDALYLRHIEQLHQMTELKSWERPKPAEASASLIDYSVY